MGIQSHLFSAFSTELAKIAVSNKWLVKMMDSGARKSPFLKNKGIHIPRTTKELNYYLNYEGKDQRNEYIRRRLEPFKDAMRTDEQRLRRRNVNLLKGLGEYDDHMRRVRRMRQWDKQQGLPLSPDGLGSKPIPGDEIIHALRASQ